MKRKTRKQETWEQRQRRIGQNIAVLKAMLVYKKGERARGIAI